MGLVKYEDDFAILWYVGIETPLGDMDFKVAERAMV